MYWFAFYSCDKDHDQKQLGDGRVHLSYLCHLLSTRGEAKGKTQADRNWEAGTEAETLEERC